MRDHPLRFFYDFIFWPNYLGYMIYIVAKLVIMVMIVAAVCYRHRRKAKRGDGNNENPSPSPTSKKILSMSPKVILGICGAAFVFTTLWDEFWLDVSFVCNDDPKVSCYPQAVDPNLTISVNLSRPIDDCQFWNSISDQVELVCFQFVYDVGNTVAAFGGLIVLLYLIAIKKHEYECLKKLTKFLGCSKSRNLLIVLGFVAFAIEIAISLVVCYFTYNGVFGSEEALLQWEAYFVNNGAETLLSIGILFTLLVVQWSDDEARRGAGDKNSNYEKGTEMVKVKS